MARKSDSSKNARIEVLEPLVLMSASAADAELLTSGDGSQVDAAAIGFGSDTSSEQSDLVTGGDAASVAISVEPDGGIGDGAGPIPISTAPGFGVAEGEEVLPEELIFPDDPDDVPGETGFGAGEEFFLEAIPVEAEGSEGFGIAESGFAGVGPDGGEGAPPFAFVIDAEESLLLPPPPPPSPEFETTVVSPGESEEVEEIFGQPEDEPQFPERPPLLLDDAISITVTAVGPTGVDQGILEDSFGTAGPEAQSGAVPDGAFGSDDVAINAGAPPFEFGPTGTSTGGDISQVPNNSFADLPTDQAGVEAQSGITEDSAAASDALVVTANPALGFPIEQPPVVIPTIEGTDVGEWIAGTNGDDVIAAGGGDDEIYAPSGNNFVDGGAGIDTFVVYEGFSDQYTIALRSDGVSTLEGPGLNGETVRVDLFNVERIQFNDRTIDLSSITTVVANPPVGNPNIIGTDAGEWIGGTAADDSINAGGGDDEIYAPLGTNSIDGGDGEDTLLVYQGNQADYVLANIGDGRIYIEGPGLNGETVRSTLSNVERILFNDGLVLTSEIQDLGDATADTVVAGASIVAAESGGISPGVLATASQAAVLIEESGFFDSTTDLADGFDEVTVSDLLEELTQSQLDELTRLLTDRGLDFDAILADDPALSDLDLDLNF